MSNTLCPRGCGNKARISPMYGVLPCFKCIGEDQTKRKGSRAPEFYTQSMQTRVQEQRDKYEKDMIPPTDHNGKPSAEFARAFPQKAKQLQEEYTEITGEEVKL